MNGSQTRTLNFVLWNGKPSSAMHCQTPKMATRVAAGLMRSASIFKVKPVEINIQRTKTTSRSGRVLPKPKTSSLSLVGSFFAANAGILTGASFSRAFANFLEEHDLFVVEDDDDDD